MIGREAASAGEAYLIVTSKGEWEDAGFIRLCPTAPAGVEPAGVAWKRVFFVC